jgi:hypothetical protein
VNIIIKVIPESEQRPEVNGADWFFDENADLQVRVSPMSDWRYETLLAIHEAVEAIMCKHNGVTVEAVDAFDQEYDKTHTFDVNAGDEPNAPYMREHCLATAIERILCAELDVNWAEYDRELAESYPGPSKKMIPVNYPGV